MCSRLQFALIVLTCFPLLASSGRAASTEPDGVDDWALTIGATVGIDFHRATGSSRTSVVRPDAIDTNPQLVRPATRGDVLITTPTAGIDVGIISPRLLSEEWSPRFFAHGSIEGAFAADTTPNAEGSRGNLRAPRDGFGDPIPFFEEDSILGQGTRGKIVVDELQLRAGLGAVFSLEVLDRRVQIRPSIEYIRKRVESSMGLTRAIQILQPLAPRTTMTGLSDARATVIDIPFTSTLHGIGPGLEVEVDASRAGPLIVTVYAGVKAFHLIGDLEEEGTRASTTSNPAFPPETATFSFEFDQWVTRIDTGVRLRWQPE